MSIRGRRKKSEPFKTGVVTTFQRLSATKAPKQKIFKEDAAAMSDSVANIDQGLIKMETTNEKENPYGDLREQVEDLGRKASEVAGRARAIASEKFAGVEAKFDELSNKDPKELLEDAKEYARRKPAQALLISAAVGLVIGWMIKRRK